MVGDAAFGAGRVSEPETSYKSEHNIEAPAVRLKGTVTDIL